MNPGNNVNKRIKLLFIHANIINVKNMEANGNSGIMANQSGIIACFCKSKIFPLPTFAIAIQQKDQMQNQRG